MLDDRWHRYSILFDVELGGTYSTQFFGVSRADRAMLIDRVEERKPVSDGLTHCLHTQ